MTTWNASLRQPARGPLELLPRHHRNNSRLSSGTKKGLTKMRKKPKPAWDSTTSDLTVFKPSPLELQRNHNLHRPKKDHERKVYSHRFVDSTYEEERFNNYRFDSSDDPDYENKENITGVSNTVNRKQALIKEVFHKQERELRQVLAETDRTMSNVQDMFGDIPLKYKGLPNITAAPGEQNDTTQAHTDAFFNVIDPHTMSFYEKLSESVMHNPELNAVSNDEFSLEDSSEDEGTGNNHTSTFQSQLDVDYYKCMVSESNESNEPGTPSPIKQKHFSEDKTRKAVNHIGASEYVSGEVKHCVNDLSSNNELDRWNGISSVDSFEAPEIEISDGKLHAQVDKQHSTTSENHSFNATIETELKDCPQNSINKRQNNCDPSVNLKNHGNAKSNKSSPFKDMKRILDILESEISDYEKETGKKNFLKTYDGEASSLTGYTAKLVSIIVRVMHHLKESEVQLRAEMSMREQIIEAFDEQRVLIDALTADLLATQEMNYKLQEELHIHKKSNQTQYAHVKLDVASLQAQVQQLLSKGTLSPASMSNRTLAELERNDLTLISPRSALESIQPFNENRNMYAAEALSIGANSKQYLQELSRANSEQNENIKKHISPSVSTIPSGNNRL